MNFRCSPTDIRFVSELGRGDKEGYLFISEKGIAPKHHYSHILVHGRKEDAVQLDPKTVSNLQVVLDCYRDEKINRVLGDSHKGYRDYDVPQTDDFLPVFYSKVQDNKNGSKYYLSPAMIGREVYHKEIRDLVGDWRPCSEGEKCCPVCALFGVVGSRSVGSALRFTDALPESPVPKEKIKSVCLKEQSSPQISTTELYTFRSPNARIWNYDYAVGDGKQKIVLGDNEPRIRGRKFYFHHPKL